MAALPRDAVIFYAMESGCNARFPTTKPKRAGRLLSIVLTNPPLSHNQFPA